MKTLRHPFILAIIALVFWSCGTTRNYAYSQGYDDYGYYEEEYYDHGGISFNVFCIISSSEFWRVVSLSKR